MKIIPVFADVKLGIIVSSVRALQIFLRRNAKLNRLPDYVVVEGPLAGGHLGFGLDWAKYDLKTIVGEIIEYLKAEKLEIPLIAAGGVFTGSDAVSFMEQGVGGVQVATRFTISKECGLPDKAKQAYLSANEDDIEVNLVSPTGYPMRMLRKHRQSGSVCVPIVNRMVIWKTGNALIWTNIIANWITSGWQDHRCEGQDLPVP